MQHSEEVSEGRMEFAEVLYRIFLCVYGTVAYGIIAATMVQYPHIHCRSNYNV